MGKSNPEYLKTVPGLFVDMNMVSNVQKTKGGSEVETIGNARRKNFLRILLIAIALVIVFGLFFLPLFKVVVMSVTGPEGFTLAVFKKLLTSKKMIRVLKNTMYINIMSSFFAAVTDFSPGIKKNMSDLACRPVISSVKPAIDHQGATHGFIQRNVEIGIPVIVSLSVTGTVGIILHNQWVGDTFIEPVQTNILHLENMGMKNHVILPVNDPRK